MKKFLKTLLGKKNKPKAPPSGDAGIPRHLIEELVAKVDELIPLAAPESQSKLQSLAEAVQDEKLDVAVRSFLAFANDIPAGAMIEQAAIMVSGQFNSFKKQEKDGLLDKQMVRQRKNGTIKQITGILDQSKFYLKQE
ncbi:MAG: hypothetical protein HRU41_32990 [Saprospiraceae bacterium]|nr:hypothetical protein [Saprospiraceae bacterium]